MDPNVNLARQRELANRILNHDAADQTDCLELAELVQALDDWLTKGGFVPRVWGQAVDANPYTGTSS